MTFSKTSRHLAMALTLAGVTALGSVGSAQAQSLEPWGSAEGWDIMVDPSLGNGCLITAEYQDGSVVRIGFDRTVGGGYVTVFNENWGYLEDGAIYPVSFDLDDQPYEGEAKGLYLGEVPGADIAFDNPDFLFDIAKKYTMTIYNMDGAEVLAIDLAGTYVALEGALECQEEMG
ncbi:MAG: hypothetical protein ACPGOY_10005 [Rhodospirillaceae bacterium]